MNQHTLFLCPSCSCHARREERECPHCGAPLTREAGTATQRSMASVAMGLALAVALPVGACEDERSGGGGAAAYTSSSQGGGGASSGDAWLTVAATSAYGTATSVNPMTSGGGCTAHTFILVPICDECLQVACCPEIEACVDDLANCFNAGGTALDPETLAGAALEACLAAECEVECDDVESSGICDSGVTSQDAETDACLSELCCAEFNACTADSADPEACNDCFEAGGGELCDAAITCFDESCPN